MVSSWIIDQIIEKEKRKDDRPRLELPVINQTEESEPKEEPKTKKNSIIHIEIYDNENSENEEAP